MLLKNEFNIDPFSLCLPGADRTMTDRSFDLILSIKEERILGIEDERKNNLCNSIYDQVKCCMHIMLKNWSSHELDATNR